MAAVTICSDFRAQGEEICHYFHLSPFYLPSSNGATCHDLNFFLILSFKLALSLSLFNLTERFFSSSLLSAIRVVSSAHLRLLMFLPPVLIPAYNSSSPAFLLIKQGLAPSLSCFSNDRTAVQPRHSEDLSMCLCASLSVFQFSSVAQSCPTPCDPINRSTPGLPVHHQLPKFTQTHVH